MIEICISCAMAGFLIGFIFMFIWIICLLHKRFYNTYRIKKENLPFSSKLKKHLNMREDEYL